MLEADRVKLLERLRQVHQLADRSGVYVGSSENGAWNEKWKAEAEPNSIDLSHAMVQRSENDKNRGVSLERMDE